MILKIDMTSDIPIYQQIRNQIVFGVAKGNIRAGESLPTVRQLANDIGVNPMTVNKAYTLLKEEGIIIIDRRHGATISSLGMKGNAFDPDFNHRVELLISEVRMKGASKQDVKKYISDLIDLVYE
ncbi:MAG: regulatory protein GntR [Oscillospiraceae bacterium]|jgi:DNA-binding transcriptional regulator YhcF (GntR family)|nr:regulatory protein GntR [Oscillospiraceae bacterium]